MLERAIVFFTKPLLLSGLFVFIFIIGMLLGKLPLIAIGLVGTIILFVISVFEPVIVMILVLFSIPFDRMAAFLGVLTAAKVLIGLVIISLVVRTLVFKDTELIKDIVSSKINYFVLLYLAFSFLSIIKAHDMDYYWYIMTRRISVGILLFLIFHVIKSLKSIKVALIALVIASFFVCTFGAYELVTGQPILESTVKGEDLFFTQEGSFRIQGVSGNPDFHAAILVMFTGLLLALYYSVESKIIRLALISLLIFYVMNIIATGSRGGEIGFLGVLIVFFIFHKTKKKWLKLGFTMAAIVIVFIMLTILSSVPTTERITGESGNKSIIYRYGWALMSLEMVKDNPIFGVGTGNYFKEYNRYQRLVPSLTPVQPFVNHNGVMQVWAENGTPGIIAFLSLLFFVLYKGFSTIFYAVDSKVRVMALGITAAYMGYMACILVFPVLENENGWLIMGLVMSISNLNRDLLRDAAL